MNKFAVDFFRRIYGHQTKRNWGQFFFNVLVIFSMVSQSVLPVMVAQAAKLQPTKESTAKTSETVTQPAAPLTSTNYISLTQFFGTRAKLLVEYQYDYENRLTDMTELISYRITDTVAISPVLASHYRYDGLGRRVEKAVTTTLAVNWVTVSLSDTTTITATPTVTVTPTVTATTELTPTAELTETEVLQVTTRVTPTVMRRQYLFDGLDKIAEFETVDAVARGAMSLYRTGKLLQSIKYIMNGPWRASSNASKLGLKKFFWNDISWNRTSSLIWEGKAAGNSMQHLLFQNSWKWVPRGLRNAGFNLLEIPLNLNRLLGGIPVREQMLRYFVIDLMANTTYSSYQITEYMLKLMGEYGNPMSECE